MTTPVVTREMTFNLTSLSRRHLTFGALKGMVRALEAANAPLTADLNFDSGHVTVRWTEEGEVALGDRK